MKKTMLLILACLAVSLMAASAFAAGTQETLRIILYTCYENVFPDGVTLEAGCVDEDGNLWTFSGIVPEADLSSGTDAYLAALLADGKMIQAGKTGGEELFDLKSLIISADDQGNETETVGEGGGAESSVAFAYDVEGIAQRILLGVSGDSRFENTDPDAQALYLQLRNLFPDVTHFGGEAGPRGYQPVSLVEFCGWQDIDFTHTVITGYDMDCEAGPIEFEVSLQEREEIIQFILSRYVTGKANATMVTGGTTAYNILDEDGNYLASMELCDGLLVKNDGMYYLGLK